MNRIAFMVADLSVYWNSVILTLAAVGAVWVFLGLYLKAEGDALAGVLATPVVLALSLVLGRLIHWYCQSDSYESLQAAMLDVSFGSFALMGAFAGCALTALLLRLVRISRNLPRMLDCMSIGGAGGMAVGRLASFYDTSARGPLTGLTELPLAYPVTNAVSGLEEYLTDSDLLPEDKIRDIITQYVPTCRKEDSSIFTYSAPTYYKTYFCVGKEGVIGADFNRLFVYACYDEYMDGEYRWTVYTPLIFRYFRFRFP